MTIGSPQDCNAAFTDALLRRDIAVALDLLSDDIVFFYSNGSAIVGKETFSKLMTANWEAVQDYEYAAADALWISQSDAVACVIYGFAWSGTVRGQTVQGSGRGTRILSNDGSGWRISHEHLSSGKRR
jgi:ketosteroid isomerase-like protein